MDGKVKDRNENRLGYKKTKAGWIPEDWGYQPAGKLFQIQLGKMLSQRSRNGINPKPYLANHNVRWGYFNLDEIREMDFSEKEIEKFVLKKGDLLVCEGGEAGRCAVWEEQIKPCLYQKALHRLRSKDGQISTSFAMYYLHRAVTSPIIVRFTGRTSISHLTREQFINFPIVLPPPREQKKIVKILSTWDRAIEGTRKLIDAKKRRKKALMQQLLTGKSRLKGFVGRWKKISLNSLFNQVSRPVEFDDSADYNLISVRRRSGGIFPRGILRGADIKTKNMYLVHTGDFLISKMQIVHGASAVVEKEHDRMHISGSYIVLKVRYGNLNADFLKWLSRTPYFYHLTYLASYGVHIEKMTFNLRLFLKSEIEIPTNTEEQQRIAEILNEADHEINILEKKLAALEKQKRGLMQKLLTGEVRVKVNHEIHD